MTKNIRLFKTTDPIVQSVLFIVFMGSIVSSVPYKAVFLVLFSWQLLSAAAHFFFRRTTMLRTQRKAHMIVALAYVAAYIYVSVAVPEKYVQDLTARGMEQFPVYSITLVALGLCICFWYSVICFREIKRILKKTHGPSEL